MGALETSFTRLVGCDVPIQLAGMGSILSPQLAAAVSNAGALGQITFAGIEAGDAKQRLDTLASLTSKPFGVNLLIPYLDRNILEMSVQKARVIDFFWGDPDPELVSFVHEAGALASWQVGSVAEAVAAEKAGCDFIIAQGVEAGGHIRGTLGLLPLLTQVLDKVKVPVLGAGGIGSGRGIAAVLATGAAGVRMGTRFIAASESNAHPDYVRAIISAQAEDSVRTDRFEVDCPMCPSTHGVLRSALDAAEAFDGSFVAELDGEPVALFRGTEPFKGFTGNIGAMACYAGQSVGEVRGVQPAAEIVGELVEGAEKHLRGTAVSA
ncbi:MAG: nitronate monooxygenase [Candidatus Dormibacteraeota bacterium]|nr:nitronate monooxygenase [Candidatus Dormibacteraeota bacterium]